MGRQHVGSAGATLDASLVRRGGAWRGDPRRQQARLTGRVQRWDWVLPRRPVPAHRTGSPRGHAGLSCGVALLLTLLLTRAADASLKTAPGHPAGGGGPGPGQHLCHRRACLLPEAGVSPRFCPALGQRENRSKAAIGQAPRQPSSPTARVWRSTTTARLRSSWRKRAQPARLASGARAHSRRAGGHGAGSGRCTRLADGRTRC